MIHLLTMQKIWIFCATFKIRDTKSYVPVVTLSTQDDNKLLQQLKTGFKRTIE